MIRNTNSLIILFLLSLCYSKVLQGRGYSSEIVGLVNEQCYNTVPVLLNKRAVTKTDMHIPYSELKKMVGTNAMKKIGVSCFGAKRTSSFLSEINIDKWSKTLNYYFSVNADAKLDVQGVGVEVLSPYGKQVYANNKNMNFAEQCGDKILTQASLGAILIVSIKIELESKQELEKLMESYKLNLLGLIKVTEMTTTTMKSKNIYGKIGLTAIQLGGEPWRLGNILGGENGEVFITHCNSDNTSQCDKAIKAIYDYANNDFIAKQLDNINNYEVFDENSFEARPLFQFGLPIGQSRVSNEIKQMRKDFEFVYKETTYLIDFWRNVIKNIYLVTDPELNFMKQWEVETNAKFQLSFVEGNYKMFKDGEKRNLEVEECYYFKETCEAKHKKLKSHWYQRPPSDAYDFLRFLKYKDFSKQIEEKNPFIVEKIEDLIGYELSFSK